MPDSEKRKDAVDDSASECLSKSEVDSIAPLLPPNHNPTSSSRVPASTDNTSAPSRIPGSSTITNYLQSVKQDITAKRKSKAIDRSLKEDRKRLTREFRFCTLLSLSGAQMIKTMRKIQSQGTTDSQGNNDIPTIEPDGGIIEVRLPISEEFTAYLFTLPQGLTRRGPKHWLSMVDGLTGVLFVVDLDLYCEVVLEDSEVNQMQESLLLFETVVNSPRFTSTTMILLFNNVELFKKKLTQHPFKKYFPEYNGGDHDVDAAVEHLVTLFNERVKEPPRDRIKGYLVASEEKAMFEQVVGIIEEVLVKNSKGTSAK